MLQFDWLSCRDNGNVAGGRLQNGDRPILLASEYMKDHIFERRRARTGKDINAHRSHVHNLAQMVEHCNGIAKVIRSNPVQVEIFFRL